VSLGLQNRPPDDTISYRNGKSAVINELEQQYKNELDRREEKVVINIIKSKFRP
jgi:hypothetical protein